MGTRKSKKDKGGGAMRPVVADNLRQYMERFFKDKPAITNRPLWLAEQAELGIGTVQRTLSGETGASIDTLEALARILRIQPYKFLMPSRAMQALLSVDQEDLEKPEELQRDRGRTPTRRT